MSSHYSKHNNDRPSGNCNKTKQKPIIAFLKNQRTGQRIRLGEFSSRKVKLGDVITSAGGVDTSIDGWIPDGKVPSLLYLRNRVPLEEWAERSLGSLLGPDALNGGSFLISLIVEDSNLVSMPRSVVAEASEANTTKKNMSIESALQLILCGPLSKRNDCISTLLKYIEGLVKFSKESDKYEIVRKINMSNSTFVSKVGSVRGGGKY